jgi:hypothetical protein
MRIIRIIVILLVGILLIFTACKSSMTPPASEYPADIIGRVTIANNLIADGKEVQPYGTNTNYWIVEVSLKNKDYQYPVSSRRDKSIPLPEGVDFIWSIIFNGKVWAAPILGSPLITVPQGESGNMIFPFEMGRDDKTSDVLICYQGQEPFSYGELIDGDSVAVYDWDLKKATQTEETRETIATVEDIWVGLNVDIEGEIRGEHPTPYAIFVELKPTSSAIANTYYIVDLYEKGKFRAPNTLVAWNQPEINVLSVKTVEFPATKEEYDAYLWEDISHIFSVKVHE